MLQKPLGSILFENNPTPMYLFKADTLDILEVNKTAVKQYGYSREEFLELSVTDLRPEEQVPVLLQFLNKNRSYTGNAGVWEHKSKEGKRFYAEIHNEEFEYQEQILILVQARVITDVTKEEVIKHAAQHEIQYHLENTLLGVVRWNQSVEVQYLSPVITEITGYTSQELLGQSAPKLIENLVESADFAATSKKVEELLDGSADKNVIDMRVRTKKGSVVSLRFYNSVLRDNNNQLVSILSIVENMTEIEATRQSLEEETEKFRLFAENSTDVISRHSPDGTYLYVSPSIEKTSGYGPGAVVGKSIYDFIHPEDALLFRNIHRNLLKTRDSLTVQFRFRSIDGSYKWLESVSKSIRDPESSRIVEIHVSSRDISDRKKLQDDLHAEEEFIRTALESMPGIFYMIDEQQKFVMWNRNMERTFDYSDTEIRQMHHLQFYQKRDHKMITANIEEVFRKGFTDLEADLFDKSGRPIPHYITGRLVEYAGEKYIVGSGINISYRKEKEKELLQSLEEKQVLLQEIHHRVKNNLAVISGLLELQKSTLPHPDVQKALSNSQLRIQSIALIHENLYQSKHLSRIDLYRVLEDLIQLSKSVLGQNNRVEIRIDCDPVQLNINQAIPCTLIINELISNAYKHAFRDRKDGQINVNVLLEDDMVTVSIADNGKGISDDVIGGEVDTLGFTIIKSLIKQLEADLDISNQDGTRIHFAFKKEVVKGSSSTLIDQSRGIYYPSVHINAGRSTTGAKNS